MDESTPAPTILMGESSPPLLPVDPAVSGPVEIEVKEQAKPSAPPLNISLVLWTDPGLKKPSVPINNFGAHEPGTEGHSLAQAMNMKLAGMLVKAMYAPTTIEGDGRKMTLPPALGLSAPQIGINVRMIAIRMPAAEDGTRRDPLVLINPEVLSVSKERAAEHEGCMSFPGLYLRISRPVEAEIGGFGVSGNYQTAKFTGTLARVALHEIDHLNGVLFVDHASPAEKIRAKKYLKLFRKMTAGK